eukprot:366007_1
MACSPTIDVVLWLKERNLGKLITEFKERNISIEELCEFEENDLKDFGIGFGLDKFDSARFAKYIMKQKNEQNSAVSRAVVITADEEALLQKLEDRKNDILHLINRADSDSSTTKKINAKNEEIIETQFAELIKQIQQKKQNILTDIAVAQKAKQSIIEKNLQTLREYLTNIENISNTYNRWLVENKMNRYERKDKLAKIVQEECDAKLLPQIADVQVIYNNGLVSPFLSEICKIVNIGLFYPMITDVETVHIGSHHATIKWKAKLSKEHLIYIEQDELDMDHIMMSLRCTKLKTEEVKDADNDVDEDEKMDENEEAIDLIHCIDYELDEETYEYSFDDLNPNCVYLITLKCISMLQKSLVSQHHRDDLNKFKIIEKQFQTLTKFKQFVFSSNLERVNIVNDGKTIRYVNVSDGVLCCVLLGDKIDTNIQKRKFKLTYVIDAKADHIGFGFTTGDFATFEHNDWGFGGHCTFYYSDRDFRGCSEFQHRNNRRLTLQVNNVIHVVVDCSQLYAQIWLDGHDENMVETTLPQEFYIAVSLGGHVGSSVTLTNCQELY